MNTLTLKVDTSSHEPVLQLAGANDDHILQQVRLTPEHPVYVLDRNGEELGWTITADLAPGDLIADIDAGQAVKVVANKYEQLTTKVYNFEVEHAHNYFADELGLWVHNASKSDLLCSASPVAIAAGCRRPRPPRPRFSMPPRDALRGTVRTIEVSGKKCDLPGKFDPRDNIYARNKPITAAFLALLRILSGK